MFRHSAFIALTAAVLMTGCSRSASPLAASTASGAASAQSFLHFSTPHSRLLAPAEQNGNFDTDLALSAKAATAWDPKPKLFFAFHAPAAPGMGGTVRPARFVYSYRAGLDALNVAIAPETVEFRQKGSLLSNLFQGTIDGTKMISGAQALATAKGTGLIKTEDPCVLLMRHPFSKDAIYSFRDAASAAPVGDAASAQKTGPVLVDAYTGTLIGDKNAQNTASQAIESIGNEVETEAATASN